MRLPVVFAFATLAALAPATGCARKSAQPPPSPLVEKGRQSYAKYCATCHGPAANGYIADNAPSLRSVTFLASASDDVPPRRDQPRAPRHGDGRVRPRSSADRSLPPEVDAIIAFLREGGPAAPRAAAAGPVVGDVKRGKVVYDANCARCHGTPTQRSSAVHLANPVLLATASDAFLRWAVESGPTADLDGPVERRAHPGADRRRGRLRALDGRAARPPRRCPPPSRMRARRCRRARDRSCSTREASAPEFVAQGRSLRLDRRR